MSFEMLFILLACVVLLPIVAGTIVLAGTPSEHVVELPRVFAIASLALGGLLCGSSVLGHDDYNGPAPINWNHYPAGRPLVVLAAVLALSAIALLWRGWASLATSRTRTQTGVGLILAGLGIAAELIAAASLVRIHD